MRCGGARDLPPVFAACHRQSAIDHDAVLFRRKFERETARVRLLVHRDRRCAAGIHHRDRAGALEPLIAGMRRIGERRAARIVVNQHGREQVGFRGPHAVEQREIAVAVAEEAQHRHHAIDRIEQRRRRRGVA